MPPRNIQSKKSPAQLQREINATLAGTGIKPISESSYLGGLRYKTETYGPGGNRQFTAPAPFRKSHKSKMSKRVAHATKASDKTSDKINIDQLAKMFGLPDWEKIDDMNQDHYWEMSRGAGDEEAEMNAQHTAAVEVYGQWYDAVERAASKLFEEHGLELEPTGKQGSPERRYDFKIVPQNSWNDAANKLRETINGVGDFHFDDLKDFLHREGPSARKAVLSHLGYIKKYPHVYGGLGAHQMYEQAWR